MSTTEILLSTLTSTGVFVLIAIVLTLILLAAEAKLVAKGDISIVVNGDASKAFVASPGTNLLAALAGQKVFLPSACGGHGTCGVCRCKVITGGGDLVPAEESHISRRDAKEHWRLACQLKLKQNVEIEVPAEIFSIKKWECEVVSNRNVATFIKEFVIRLPPGERMNFVSGGFIQIEIPPYEADFKTMDIDPKFHGDWDKFNLWSLKAKNPAKAERAYSMANHPAEGDIVMLNVRIATPPFDRAAKKWADVNPGIASSYVFSRKPGDKVTISGPFGEFHIQDTQREMMYIGGGAGMAPLRSHIFHLFHTLKTGRKVSYWYGARSMREIFYEEHFRAIEAKFPNFKFHIALSEPLPEDNWKGYVGFIHNVVLENYLKKHRSPEDIEYYLCGPPMMSSAVRKMLDELGVEPNMIRFDDFGS